MRTHRRAAALGVAGTSTALALAVWLGHVAAGSWPGLGPVPLDAALAFLTTLVAAGTATWVSAVLAAATVPLLGPAGALGTGSAGGRDGGPCAAAPRREAGGPVARVTAALLTAAALGLVSPAAHGAVATRGGQEVLQDVAQEQAGPSEVAVDPDGTTVPVPGWTPPPEPTPVAIPATCRNPAQGTRVTTTHSDRTGRHRDEDDHVVVHRGDSLWSIAADHLGAHATERDVAEAWPRWYAANRGVIGDDPDHILPGQVLVVPARTGR